MPEAARALEDLARRLHTLAFEVAEQGVDALVEASALVLVDDILSAVEQGRA